MREKIHGIKEIKGKKRTLMRKYVASYPSKFDEKVKNRSVEGVAQLFKDTSEKAEAIFRTIYSDIRKKEKNLPHGQRFHKGDALYWWGISLIIQKAQDKISEGYEKLILAFIEDLLDFPSYKQARKLPACYMLQKNPAIGRHLLDLVEQRVREQVIKNEIPKNPEEVLKPINIKTKEALEKPINVTITQIKPAIEEWLEKCGQKEQRVFIGGNYQNIAILRLIEQIVRNFDFVPIMPINFPETSASHEKLIHDKSMEILRGCSFAIFEVTISNGHLMEIERAKDFRDLKTILVYQVSEHGEKPTVTRMLMTDRLEKKGYRNFDEIRTIIKSFLSP